MRRAMNGFTILRMILLAVAAFGYFANGAQAHLQLSHGESLQLMLCGTATDKTVELVLPGDPAKETLDTCCGDCTPPVAVTPPQIVSPPQVSQFAQPVPAHLPPAVSPKSPLWPGAPPHGPPAPHTQSA